MSIDELIDYMSRWEPDEEWMGPSPEGLGRQLATAAKADPDGFAIAASKFTQLNPTYVRGFLHGLEESLKEGKDFRWEPVVRLCAWVVEQPREIPGRRRGERGELDPGWIWTRKAIASLLRAGFDADNNEIPYNLRESVWGVIAILSDDPEPTPEYEERYGGSNMDPATLSINTTRGEAMHAVIRYALWVRRHLEDLPDAATRLALGFDEMPEVKTVLDEHLNPSRDPSLAIRAVYGQWLPWIILLDRSWAEANVGRIFPPQQDSSALRDAAWETYIVFCRPYDSAFEVLQGEYMSAIDRIGQASDSLRHADRPDDHLAEHIMTFYWQGKLPPDDPENLLGRFLSRAPVALRGQAMGFAGRAIRNASEVPDRILDRLRDLWSRRLESAIRSGTPVEFRDELANFGWWFASGRFEDRWALEQLEAVLKSAGDIDPEHLVAERLVATVPSFPEESVRCLRLMIQADKEGWRVLGSRTEVREILRIALASGSAEAREAATETIHILGARGHRDFRDLLQVAQ